MHKQVFCLDFKVLVGFMNSVSYLKKGMCVCVFRATSLLENSRMFDQKGESHYLMLMSWKVFFPSHFKKLKYKWSDTTGLVLGTYHIDLIFLYITKWSPLIWIFLSIDEFGGLCRVLKSSIKNVLASSKKMKLHLTASDSNLDLNKGTWRHPASFPVSAWLF